MDPSLNYSSLIIARNTARAAHAAALAVLKAAQTERTYSVAISHRNRFNIKNMWIEMLGCLGVIRLVRLRNTPALPLAEAEEAVVSANAHYFVANAAAKAAEEAAVRGWADSVSAGICVAQRLRDTLQVAAEAAPNDADAAAAADRSAAIYSTHSNNIFAIRTQCE